MRPAIIGVLAMTGCLRDPVFGQHNGDASTDGNDIVGCPIPLKQPTATEQVVASVTPFGAGIAGPGYGVNFATEVGSAHAAFPTGLNIGSTRVLDESAAMCGDPNKMGVLFDPGGAANADDPGTSLVVNLDAPLIGQLTSSWAKSYMCQSVATMRGETTFTGFPDGRLVRYDAISHEGTVDASTCPTNMCGPRSAFTVASYTRFAKSSDVGVQGNCINHDLTARTAIAIDGTSPDPAPLRTLDTTQYVAYDWWVQSGSSLVSGDLGAVATTMYLSSTKSCTELNARLALDHPLVQGEAPFLLVEGVASAMSPVDGIYRSGGVDGNFHGATRLTIRPGAVRIGDGFALELDLGPYSTLRVVRSRCVADEWYGVQPAPNGFVLLWFSGGLAPDETITLDIMR